MNVLVTGDMGHLGQRIRWQLDQGGHDGSGYDLKRGEDICDTQRLIAVLEDHDCVVHAAAHPHPRPAWGFEPFWQTNVEGTLSVLRAAIAAGVRRVVFLSSVGYYGVNIRGELAPAYLPIDEGHPIAATDGYSAGALDEYNQSKVICEQLMAYYGSNQLIETVSLRIGPANSKATQYPEDFDWREDRTYRRKCLFANCHPDYAARAVVLAVEYGDPLWGEAFNIFDRYTHESVDLPAFLARDYPGVEGWQDLGEHGCLFSTGKAETWLGFEPCEELR